MGYIIKPTCKCIENEKTYNLGLGRRDFGKTYQNELAYCNACKDFFVAGRNDLCSCGVAGQRIYTMDMMGADVTVCKCPRCGDKLSINMMGYWD